MSMMGTEQVGLDFSVTGNYGTTLTQMIQQSDQYARSADTMIGKIASLNVVTVALLSRTTALTGANRVATAEAAAYQQKLAVLAPTAAVVGQNMDKLAGQTLALAREFGSIDAAVATMKTLQESGLNANDSVTKLAKTFMQLDAANSSFGGQIGSGLLTLGRTFGNSTAQLSKFGDSLTSLSAKYGANAQGALAFAQALAPVASSVGVSQGAVLGLGTAAARLGQDGYAGANAFNKVLLDMSSSIRNGNPQIKEYAQLLNMTTTNLAAMFKSDPSEVVLRFTEAIGKGGANAQRSLEALGFDAVRTTKALTAISSQGNLRQIVDDASKQYGSGSTSKAAESALDTVNHKAQVLQETLSQTVSNAGKPFLSWLGMVEDAANSAAGAVNSIISNDFVQKIGSVAAPVAFAGGAVAQTAGLLGTVALGRQAFNFGRSQLQDFRGARDFVRAGGTVAEDASLAVRAGSGFAGMVPTPVFVPPGAGSGARGLRYGLRGAANTLAGALSYQGNLYSGADWRTRAGSFEETQSFRNPATMARKAEMSAIAGSVAADKSLGNLARQGMAGATSLGRFTKASFEADGALGRLAASAAGAAKSMVLYGGRELRAAGGVAARGVGAAGNMLSALTGGLVSGPVGLGITAAVGAGFAVKSFNDEQAGIREKGLAGAGDAYGQYNDFAAAAGLAGKGALSLAQALQESTKQILDNNKTMGQALNPNDSVVANALSPGYQRAFTAMSTTDSGLAAFQARLLLGSNPTVGATSRVVSDFVNQSGGNTPTAKSFSNNLKDLSGQSDLSSQFLREVPKTASWVFGRQTDDTAKMVSGYLGNVADYTKGVTDVYGAKAGDLANLAQSSGLFSAYQKSPGGNSVALGATADVLSKTTGIEDSDFWVHLLGSTKGGGDPNQPKDLQGSLRYMLQKHPNSIPDEYRSRIEDIVKMGDISKPNYAQSAQSPETQASAFKIEGSFTTVKTSADSLAHALFGAEEAAAKLGTTVDKLTPEQVAKSFGTAAAAVNASAANPERADLRQAAGNEVAGVATRGSGGNLGTAALQLQLQQGNLSENDPRRKVIDVALQQISRQQTVANAGMGSVARMNQAIATAGQAQAAGPQTDPTAEAARNTAMDAGVSAMTGKMDFLKQYIAADKSMQIQLGRQDEDAAKQRARSERDYEKQRLYALEDFGRQRMRSQRDFNLSMTRAAEDAAKSIYKPYERMAAQQVWDANSLIANMSEQNAALAKQTQNVARLRKMGLSQQAVDQLDLSNTDNRQQVDRLLNDLLEDPSLVRKLNQTATTRGTAAKGATQNANNVDFRRANEDFRKSMRDASTDFATSMARSADAHRVALGDMAVDLATSRKRAQQDLVRMGEEVTGDLSTLETDFLSRVAKLPTGMTASMSANMKLMIGEAARDAGSTLDTVLKPWGMTADTLAALIKGAVTGVTRSENSGQGIGANQGRGGSTTMGSLPNSASGALRMASSISAGPPMRPGLCDHFVGEAYGLAHSGYMDAREHWMKTPGKYRAAGSAAAPPGALVFWDVGKDGHVALSAGGGMVWSTDFKRQGHVDLVKIADISKNWGPLYGWTQPYFGGKTTPLERGAVIGSRVDNVTLGEAGREVVLPLNQHGARVMAETMARYLDSGTAQSTRVAPYATPTASYVYDQRVMITGPVSVAAQDPNQMGRKLAAKQRLDALRQPVGGR